MGPLSVAVEQHGLTFIFGALLIFMVFFITTIGRKIYHCVKHPYQSNCGQRFATENDLKGHQTRCESCRYPEKDRTALCGQLFATPAKKNLHEQTCDACFEIYAAKKIERKRTERSMNAMRSACGHHFFDESEQGKALKQLHEHSCHECRNINSRTLCFTILHDPEEKREHEESCPVCRHRRHKLDQMIKEMEHKTPSIINKPLILKVKKSNKLQNAF